MNQLKSIYIPICFYYFETEDQAQRLIFDIYIPICFYYFICSERLDCCRCCIYIPICFYYFVSAITNVQNWGQHLHSNMFLLFQIEAKSRKTDPFNLHSNMFLLFPGNAGNRTANFSYLHSNMFLLFLQVECVCSYMS